MLALMSLCYRLAAFLLTLFAAGLMVACGGDDETTTTETVTVAPTDDTTTDTATETTSEAADKYPERARENYMTSCLSTSAGEEATCRCVLEELERTVPFKDFVKIDADLRAGGAPPRKITDALAACLEDTGS